MADKQMKVSSIGLFLKNAAFFSFVVIPALVLAPLVLVWAVNGLLTFSLGVWSFFGFIPVAVGVVFMFNMFWFFATLGKGTPAAFDPPKRLITQGLFHYVRNPGYFGALLILVGEGVILKDAVIFVYAFFMWLMFHIFVVYYEEPHLRKDFGVSYDKYLQTVPRWIPRRPKKAK